MEISAFSNKSTFDQMKRELNRALSKDRKAERQSDNAGEQLRNVFSSKNTHDPTQTEFYPKLQKYIPWIRQNFSKNVIRRTLDSKDNLGRKIFGMKPYQEHVMLVELRPWEKDVLNKLTNQIVDHAPLTTVVGAGKVRFQPSLTQDPQRAFRTLPHRNADLPEQNFYIEFRRGLLHPHMNPNGNTDGWQKPQSLEQWNSNASSKLDILARIVSHHLQHDNGAPLEVCEDGQTVKVDEYNKVEDIQHSECDRVVIFSAFPSSNAAIHDVTCSIDSTPFIFYS